MVTVVVLTNRRGGKELFLNATPHHGHLDDGVRIGLCLVRVEHPHGPAVDCYGNYIHALAHFTLCLFNGTGRYNVVDTARMASDVK